MSFKIYSVIFVLVSAAIADAQEPTREQRIDELRTISSEVVEMRGRLNRLETRQTDLAARILAVDDVDVAEARKAGADALRVFPAGVLNGLLPNSFGESDRSVCTFPPGVYSETAIVYRNNSLEFDGKSNGFGFIANLGGTLLETISEQTREAEALAKYVVPDDPADVPGEFSVNGQTFRNKVLVVSGNTYLARAFDTRGEDGIYGFKIQRMDSDRSLVLFVRRISDLSAEKPEIPDLPSPAPIPDYHIQQEVTNSLMQRGFYNILVEATTIEVTLRGTVPKDRMAEAIQTAMEIAKRKINNQLTEQ